jgi:hypothetical protein
MLCEPLTSAHAIVAQSGYNRPQLAALGGC